MQLHGLQRDLLGVEANQQLPITDAEVALPEDVACKHLYAWKVVIFYYYFVVSQSYPPVWVDSRIQAVGSLVFEDFFFVKVEQKGFKFVAFLLIPEHLARPHFDTLAKHSKRCVLRGLKQQEIREGALLDVISYVFVEFIHLVHHRRALDGFACKNFDLFSYKVLAVVTKNIWEEDKLSWLNLWHRQIRHLISILRAFLFDLFEGLLKLRAILAQLFILIDLLLELLLVEWILLWGICFPQGASFLVILRILGYIMVEMIVDKSHLRIKSVGYAVYVNLLNFDLLYVLRQDIKFLLYAFLSPLQLCNWINQWVRMFRELILIIHLRALWIKLRPIAVNRRTRKLLVFIISTGWTQIIVTSIILVGP